VGLAFSEDEDVQIGFSTDITNVTVDDNANIQDGDNRGTLSQSSTAATGDGVGGEVIGAVTSAGGSASIVAANRSTNSDVTTGDANASNDASSFVGLANADDEVEVALGDLSNIDVTADGNLQNGSNHLTLDQTASSSTGDGIAGQVLGVVSAGAASVDARNTSDDVSATSGDATTANDAAEFVGEAIGRTESIEVGPGASDIANATGTNIQDGSNRKTQTQSASATSGDAVAGQVLAGVTAGVITGAGGSASVVVANTSSNLDSTSGDATFDNGASDFIGQAFTTGPVTIAPLT
jgi:hypothetical protein